VQQQLGSTEVGFFCQPVLAMPTDLCPRPYVSLKEGVASIEGALQDVCTLRYTSCAAHVGTSGYSAGCGVDASGQPATMGAVRGENDLCGAEGLEDGYCVFKAGLGYRCTTPCAADEDCPDLAGVSCSSLAHEEGPKNLC